MKRSFQVLSVLCLTLSATGENVDEYMAGAARTKDADRTVPYEIGKLPAFDPVKAGWKKVFEDEFDGDSVDWTKWFGPYYDPVKRDFASTDGKGHLRIAVRMKPGTTNVLESTSLYTSQAFGYGYYEARLRFSEKPGWWAAFWGYGDVNTNPFLDGFEPDGFEDFYTRRRVWREKGNAILAHNLHVRSGLGRSKSFSYLSRLPRGVDEWYDFGMLHTPFEISYYLDGKLIRSHRMDDTRHPHDTVTFDAFSAAACTAPLHAALSGCIMAPGWGGDLADLDGVSFPDSFEVDRVRVYAMPDPPETRLSVSWSAGATPVEAVATGSVIRLAVDVKPSARGAAPKAVYLFDNGYFLQCRTNPPYAFELPLTEEYLKKTAYMRPGDVGETPPFNGLPHVFHAFAQDASGRIGRTAEPVVRVPRFGGSTPYGGRPQRIPGKVSPAHFDEGGIPFGYYKHEGTVLHFRDDLNPRPSRAFRPGDHASCSAAGDAIDFVCTGEWMNYTVDVATAGDYMATFPYGTPGRGINRLDFLVDGRFVAGVALEGHADVGFARDRTATVRFPLPAGRHVLTLLPTGPLSFGTIDFRKTNSK